MKLVPKVMAQTVGRQILLAKKNSPQVFFAAGVVGVIGGTVMACRATLKLPETLEDIKKDIYAVKEHKSIKLASPETIDPEAVELEHNRTLALVYIHGAAKVSKLYGPAIIVGSVSIAALTGSHIAMTRRNAALTAAYATLAKGFDEYRSRVRDEIGEERENHIYHKAEMMEIEDDETGKKIKALVAGQGSQYARVFDESNPNWVRNVEYNRLFIQCQLAWCNQLLHARGHVFLNEVYKMLGFDHTKAGAVVGWVKDGEGDNHIDFGLYDPNAEDFMFGPEQSVWLDFNVDGLIYDKI